MADGSRVTFGVGDDRGVPTELFDLVHAALPPNDRDRPYTQAPRQLHHDSPDLRSARRLKQPRSLAESEHFQHEEPRQRVHEELRRAFVGHALSHRKAGLGRHDHVLLPRARSTHRDNACSHP
jgi:hypothetical protein